MSDVFRSLDQLGHLKLAQKRVRVEQWDLDVIIQELTQHEVDGWKASMIRTKGGKVVALDLKHNSARLLALAIRDENGARIIHDHQISVLMNLGSGALGRLERIARELSGLDETEEETEGNSEAGLTGSSPSDSHPTLDGQSISS